MSRSFAILFREERLKTPDPSKPGKMLSQPRLAEILGVNVNTVRMYEYGHRLPHPLVRREIFRLFPRLGNTV